MEYKLFVKTKPCRKRRRKGPGELASMDPLLFLFIYGVAVQRDEAKRNRAAAWLDRKTHLTFHYTAHTSV